MYVLNRFDGRLDFLFQDGVVIVADFLQLLLDHRRFAILAFTLIEQINQDLFLFSQLLQGLKVGELSVALWVFHNTL